MAFGDRFERRETWDSKRLAALSEPRLKLLARRLRRALTAPAGREGSLRAMHVPLSFAQERVWFSEQSAAGSPVNNNGAVVGLSGPLDVVALGRSLAAVVARHSVLRARFALHDGGLVQTILPPAGGGVLAVADLSGLGAAAAEALALRRAQEEIERPLALGSEGVFRPVLLRLGEREHLLVLVLHMLASDGWSLGVLLHELCAGYEACCRGRSLHRPPPMQYAEHAIRQSAREEAWRRELDFWERELAGAPPLTALPLDRPRSGAVSSRGGLVEVDAPPMPIAALQGLCESEEATPFMIFVAVFAVLLHRYGGQQEVVVGSPVFGRNEPEAEDAIGHFLNTLALRIDLAGRPRFRDLLRRVRSTMLAAFDRSEAPFERVVQRLALRPERGCHPLFQTMAVMNNAPFEPRRLGEAVLTPLRRHDGTTKFDLALFVHPSSRGFHFALNYRSDLFDSETVSRLGRHFARLLAAATDAPDERVARLPMITDDERRRIVHDWNATASSEPGEVRFHELFQRQARTLPTAPCLELAGRTLAYREVEARAGELARRLIDSGVRAGEAVGLCLDRSFKMVTGFLAVLQAGGVALPLDPSYPEARLAHILEDSGCRTVLTEDRFRGLPVLAGRRLLGGGWEGEPDGGRWALPPDGGVPAREPAYLLYTSGTTGRPKGVLVHHGALANLAGANLSDLGIGAGDRILQFASFSFDAAIWEIAAALANGATLVLCRRERLLDPAAIPRLLSDLRITIAKFPASVLSEMPVVDLPFVKALISAGEACPAALAAQWAERVPFFNAYGPTEAGVWATLDRFQPARTPRLSLGRPIRNVTVYTMDPELHLLPAGCPGEVCIGGAGVGMGYLGQPELTARRFVPDPCGTGGDRLFRTGDVGRWLADGRLELAGRADRQVKLRGFRIELEEIEAVLATHPQIRSAAVELVGEAGKDHRLVAWYVASAPVTVSELRAFLGARCPSFMVPAEFIPLGSMPTGPSRKLDRPALRRSTQPGPDAPPSPRLYRVEWKPADRAVAGGEAASPLPRRWLVVRDGTGLWKDCSRLLRGMGCEVLIGGPAGEACDEARDLVLDPRRPDSFGEALARLEDGSEPACGILHLASAGEVERGGLAGVLESSFYALFHLAQARSRSDARSRLRLDVVTSGLFAVTGGEALEPGKATLLGPAKVMPQELPAVECRCLDLDPAELSRRRPSDLATRVMTALARCEAGAVAALRHETLWRRHFVETGGEPEVDRGLPLQQSGVYLLSGGLGGIGLTLARYLAEHWRARLVLVGRRVPSDGGTGRCRPEEEGADETKRAGIRDIRRLGGEVITFSCDVADPDRLAPVIAAAQRRFGRIRGVLHLAGVPNPASIAQMTRDQAAAVLAPKVQGCLALAALLPPETLDFLVLGSSMASIVGGFGSVAYTAGSAFLDAFAASRCGGRVTAIDWGTWREVGMAARGRLPGDLQPYLARRLRGGIDPRAGVELFCRALACREEQILVAQEPPPEREGWTGILPGVPSAEDLYRQDGTRAERPRPRLAVPLELPSNSVEEWLAGIWRTCLGVAPVGVEDDLFDLGGHSIVVSRIHAMASDLLGVELAVAAIFEHPTVRGLAGWLTGRLGGRRRAEEICATLLAVDALASEEAAALLAQERRGEQE